ncbi:MAG: CocE/NonD family hydrolase [Nocardioidaceae bacterium]|nr:CocE/NonD family hydrolase [Nocardioidaceae bacterium]
MRLLTRLVTIALALLALGVVPAHAEPSSWEPGPELYDVVVTKDIPITMRDGRVLRGALHAPAIKGTTTPAPGPFPVILVQTPYGKSVDGSVNAYLVKRGYLTLVVDVAGTGGSEGQSMLFGDAEAKDGAELVDYAAALPRSTGEVGLLGLSYLGIDQVFTAAEVGPGSPLKAIFPIATAADPYRDLFVSGGLVNMESSLGLIAGYFGLRTFTPFEERWTDPFDALRLSIEHGLAGIPFELTTGLDALLQQGRVYDSPYWQERAPQRVLDKVVANGIPAYVVGGQYDVFQRGEPFLYSGLQNAWAGRPVTAPMEPGQQVTSRYQLLWGPWDHGNQGAGLDLNRIELAWFDHWLKGVDTGITDTDRPMHVIEPGGDDYRLRTYPNEDGALTRLYLAPSRRLQPAAPTATTGSSKVYYKGLSLLCSQSINQWGAGTFRSFLASCDGINKVLDLLSPGDVSYDTAPLAAPLRLAGPIGLTLRVTSNRPETMIVSELWDVAPDGSRNLVTGGGMLGSLRAVDASRSWASADGSWLYAHHPYTKESASPVPTSGVGRQDIEIRPSFVTIPAGHRLRLVLKTGDTPHLLPPPMRQAELLLGVYGIQNNATSPSYLDLWTR